jgi:hypothetical protein
VTCLPPPKEIADPRDVGQLAEPLRSRVAQLIADAPTGGLVLVSGKRTDYQQWQLRHERCPGRECDRRCAGHPTTAVPGRSNHRNLSATVAAADLGGRELGWANQVKARYGLHTPVRGEPWHFEPHGTPTIAIRPFGATTGPREVLRPGERGDDVAGLQRALNTVTGRWPLGDRRPIVVDGVYGGATTARVLEFEKMHNRALAAWGSAEPRLHQDGIATKPTRDAVLWWAAQAKG